MKAKATSGLSTGTKVVIFIACIAAPLVVGFSSSMLAGDIQGKYNAMTQPPLAPPDFIFGFVWSVLYIAMGLALFLVVTAGVPNSRKISAIGLFIAQLVVNYAWSPVFFGGTLWLALGIIVFLDLLVLAMVGMFYRIRRVAGLLVAPYLVWILFATYLNVAFAILN